MRSLFTKLLLLLLPIELLVILINIFVDPGNILRKENYYTEIAVSLVAGNNIDNLTNYDERLLKREYIKTVKDLDFVVLGSSRVMELGNSFINRNKIVNLGVSHATINDLIALTGVMDSCKKVPKEELIGVDPFMICKTPYGFDTEWESIKEYHNYFTSNFIANRSFEYGKYNLFKKYLALISFTYLKQSIDFWHKGIARNYNIVFKNNPVHMGRFSDGSISYDNSYKNIDTLLISSIARESGNKDILPEPDFEKIKQLRQLIHYNKSHNIKTTLLMVPWHIDYFNGVNLKTPYNFKSYNYLFRNLAKDENVNLIGSFNPADFNIGRDAYYDLYHCKSEYIYKILSIEHYY